MWHFSNTLSISDSTFSLLRDMIHIRTGIFFEDSKKDLLASKLSPLIIELGFSSFIDLYYLLKYDNRDEDWLKVIDALSVQETYFWREYDQVRTLVEVLVPDWVEQFPGQTVRIWSAACASGEEALSIAMALNEAGWFDRASIEIVASDASSLALEKAMKGVYRPRAFRALPPALKQKYFLPYRPSENHSEPLWQVSPELHGRIQWRLANLADERETAVLAAAPFIFCRNVFIYFSPEAIQKTVETFFNAMPVPGYLFIGASESLFRITTQFALREINGAFVYIKS
jgi:chemotaxis protein methyltransferase CheR